MDYGENLLHCVDVIQGGVWQIASAFSRMFCWIDKEDEKHFKRATNCVALGSV